MIQIVNYSVAHMRHLKWCERIRRSETKKRRWMRTKGRNDDYVCEIIWMADDAICTTMRMTREDNFDSKKKKSSTAHATHTFTPFTGTIDVVVWVNVIKNVPHCRRAHWKMWKNFCAQLLRCRMQYIKWLDRFVCMFYFFYDILTLICRIPSVDNCSEEERANTEVACLFTIFIFLSFVNRFKKVRFE